MILDRQGYRFDRPLTRVREYVEVVRRLIAGETVTYRGKTIGVHDVKLDFAPYRASVPVYLGVTGPKALELAGEIADGVVLNGFVSAEYTRRAVKRIEIGARRVGRDPSAVGLGSVVTVSIDRDRRKARDGVRGMIATYPTTFPNIAQETGFPEEDLARVRAAFTEGGPVGGAKAVAEYMVDALTAAGTPDDVRERVAERRAAGVDIAVLCPVTGNLDLALRELADA